MSAEVVDFGQRRAEVRVDEDPCVVVTVRIARDGSGRFVYDGEMTWDTAQVDEEWANANGAHAMRLLADKWSPPEDAP